MKQWLDKIIELQNELCETQRFDDDLKICIGNLRESVHIFKNIEKLAEAVGIKLITKTTDNEEYPIKKYFIYKNIEVFQLNTKEGK